jgi:hypothetical protein
LALAFQVVALDTARHMDFHMDHMDHIAAHRERKVDSVPVWALE